MATLREVLTESYRLAGIPISDSNFIANYNRALHDLAMAYDTAKKTITQSIVCVDPKTEYALTSGCIGIDRVLDANGDPYKYFSVRDNTDILFSNSGTYTVYEKVAHTDISTMTDTPTISALFNYAIAKYIAAKALQGIDVDRFSVLLNEFMADAAAVNASIRKVNNKTRIMKAPTFR